MDACHEMWKRLCLHKTIFPYDSNPVMKSFPRKRESRDSIRRSFTFAFFAAKGMAPDVTSNLIKRVYEHKNDLVKGFTQRYKFHRLVWYETHESWESAIKREEQLKKWKRAWKLIVIEKSNPSWDDLYEAICG
jgi:putative endonuclease